MAYSKGFGRPPAQPVEYVFGQQATHGEYTVSKFAGGEQPLEEYRVQIDLKTGKQLSCECMAWLSKKTRPCKHYKMLKQWLDAGSPEVGEYVCLGKGSDWVFELRRPV